jgi:cytochrome c oxidase subunit 2
LNVDPPIAASQSVLEPASQGAHLIGELTWVMVVGAALVLLFVMALLIRGANSRPREINVGRWLIGGGLLFPTVVLAALLIEGVRVGSTLSHDPDLKTMEIDVVAHRWWWELRYRDPQGGERIVLANELHLPLDCAATLRLTTGDVIHSFWVPALGGKVDVIPGQQGVLAIHASRAGVFRGQCAEYCGTQHSNMGLEVVVESPQQFRDWLLNQAKPAVEPADDIARRGQQVFVDSGCGTCHTIRGTTAAGRLGPDLTHMASRRLLAAATVANDAQSLAIWIQSAQHVKPGNLMPAMPTFDHDDLPALAAYLGSLH